VFFFGTTEQPDVEKCQIRDSQNVSQEEKRERIEAEIDVSASFGLQNNLRLLMAR
jgi:hypothetical protein